jgi:hypothetical protein
MLVIETSFIHSPVYSLNNKHKNRRLPKQFYPLFYKCVKFGPLPIQIKVVQAKGAEDNTGPEREALIRAQRELTA